MTHQWKGENKVPGKGGKKGNQRVKKVTFEQEAFKKDENKGKAKVSKRYKQRYLRAIELGGFPRSPTEKVNKCEKR